MRLRLLGVQLCTYMDNLLIVGDSEVEATQSVQDLVYIEARFRMDVGRLYLPVTWI